MNEYKTPDYSIHSRWASHSEIKDSLYKVEKNRKPEFGGIPLFCEDGAIYVDHTDTHTNIVGGTGSKKTRNIAIPALQIFSRAEESFVATDPKGELYERTLPLLKKEGYKIFVLNLRDPKSSNSWNPLFFPYKFYKKGNQDRAIELVTDMANCMMQDIISENDPYWHTSAANLLSGLILTLFECSYKKMIHLKSLRSLRAISFFENDKYIFSSPLIKEIFLKHLNKNAFVNSILNGTIDAPETTRNCIISVFDQSMRPFFGQDDLIDMLSGNDIDMSNIGKTKTAVFLIIPDEHTLYHRLISVFVKQCYTALILEAQKQPNKRLPVRVNFLLDEFSSLPPISDFSAMITASRSRNIRFHLVIQSLNQLIKRYGKDAETIRGNCENWIFLHSREISLLNELVALSGVRKNEEPLVSVSMLQTFDKNKGETLIFHKRLHPFIANLMDIEQYQSTVNNHNQIEYPRKDSKEIKIFDLEKYCSGKDAHFFSKLFCSKTRGYGLN